MGKEKYANDHQGMVVTETKKKVQEPPMYRVILHNDDYTTMDFVIMVLQIVFHKDAITAAAIMVNVHKKGAGVAGIYTREVAETKVAMVHELAKKNEHPLRCSMERV